MRADMILWSRPHSGRHRPSNSTADSNHRSGSGSRPSSGRREKVRYVDLSVEGLKDLTFHNGPMDFTPPPHGGHKGLKKHPLGIHSFNKGGEYQRQLKDDVAKLFEQEHLDAHGSPRWALEVHRLPTHSGDSPLFTNRVMSASKYEAVNGSGFRERRSTPRSSGSRSATPGGQKGELYYRPNSTHQYLSATELKDATDCEDVVRYGRPTRTTLLRARHRVGSASTNAYEVRRQKEQRADEIRSASAFNNPKEFVQDQPEVDGASFYSFLTGARYNRAHCLDSKSLMQYGVYMPRSNPLGCFVIGQRADVTDSPRADDTPRSARGEGSRPATERRRRPTTAPELGKRSVIRSSRSPRHLKGDNSATASSQDRKGDRAVREEGKVSSPRLNVTRNRQTVVVSREGPLSFECKLPFVHGTSLTKLRQFKDVSAIDTIDAHQPPPSPAITSARGDNLAAALPTPESGHTADLQNNPPGVGQPPDNDLMPSADDNEPVDNAPEAADDSGAVQTTGETERAAEGADNAGETSGQKEDGVGPEDKAEEEEIQQEALGEQETAAGGEEGKEEEGGEEETGGDAEERKEEAERAEDGGEGAGTVDGGVTLEPGAASVQKEAEDPPLAQTTQPEQQRAEDDRTFPDDVTEAGNQPGLTSGDQPPTSADVSSSSATTAPRQVEGPEEPQDEAAFFVTEGQADLKNSDDVTADQAVVEGEEVDVMTSESRAQEEDRLSSASSRKSRGKRSVSFREEPHLVETIDLTEPGQPRDGGNSDHRDLEQDVEDDEQENEDVAEPFNVIVTHIEQSMGAPVPRGREGDADQSS